MNVSRRAVFVCFGIFIMGIGAVISCPPGVPLVNCDVDPCDGYTCYDPPGLTCRSNYCGGCNRDWYNTNGVQTGCNNEG